MTVFDDGEPDFENPEHQKKLLSGHILLKCKQCNYFRWELKSLNGMYRKSGLTQYPHEKLGG